MASLHQNPNAPEELQYCGICEESYDDSTHQAKFLNCFHTFCSQCLESLSNREQVNPAIIQCPNCRSDTQLPDNGIGGLQTNFYVISFQEFSKTIETPSAAANFQGCHGHNNHPIAYFCLTCGVSACKECAAEDHTAEYGHSVISVSQSQTCYLQELNVSQKSLNLNKRKQKLIESEMTLLTAAKDIALKEMDKFMQQTQDQLEQRRNVLKSQILDQFNAQQSALLDKQNEIKEAIELINKNKAQAKIMTKIGDVGNLKPICESLKEVNEKTQSILSKMDLGDNYFAFDTNKGYDAFKECLHTLGDIQCKGSLPTTMRLQNLAAKVGHKSVLPVEVYNHHGEKLTISSNHFSVGITDPNKTEIHTDLCTTGPQCAVTFTPKIRGLHQVSGFFLGQKLIGEQTHISVSDKPILKFGKKGNGKGTFNGPWSIDIDNNDILYVTDRNNRLIQKFSTNGDFLNQFSVNGHDKDRITLDVALDFNNGLIYCIDIVLKNEVYSKGNNMLVFNLDGEFQHIYNLSNVPNPITIALNNHGDLFISDITKLRVVKVDKEGNSLCQMGDFGYPGCITIADDDSVIVSDNENDCIYIFNPDGSTRHKFGSSGTGKGQLTKPWGVATDGEYILVAESENNRIQVFRCDGTFVSMIESQDDPLNTPRGLAVTKDGHVYVADCNNHCIKKYKYRDEM